MNPARLRVLSFTTVFPRPEEPHLGSFVRSRLQWMAREADIAVVAPVPLVDYGNPRRKLPDRSRIPASRQDGALRVYHPAWFYPPAAGALNPWLLAAAASGTVRRLRAGFPFAVVDAHFGFPDGAAAALLARRLRCPFTVTLRGNEVMHGAHPLRRAWLRWSLRRAAAVISLSEKLRDYALALGVAPERIAVVPNGIDPGIFRPLPRDEARRRLGMSGGRLHLLSVGHLIELKGHHRIVRCLPRLHAAGLPADLWIVGDTGRGEDFSGEIRKTAAACGVEGQVHLMPAVQPEQVAEYLNAADVFCLASSREGSPNVVNEALACGCPVVATDVGGARDRLPDERYGRIVPPGEENALTAALAEALTAQWDRAAIAAWGQARSWEHVAREALDRLRAAADEFRRGG